MSWQSGASAADISLPDGFATAPVPPDTPGARSQPLAAELANVPAAVQALQRAGVIAIPTDTLYGEGCHVCSIVGSCNGSILVG